MNVNFKNLKPEMINENNKMRLKFNNLQNCCCQKRNRQQNLNAIFIDISTFRTPMYLYKV